MSKPTRKPTGSIGPFEVDYDGKSINVRPCFVGFPETKEEVEEFVMRGFCLQAAREGLLPSGFSVQRNPMDHLDFTVETADSRKYLELMEVAPLESARGSHHVTTGSFKPYELAAGVMDKLRQKSARYSGVARRADIVLLLYITHWTFTPNGTTLMLLQYWCHHEPHSFSEIYFYRPHDEQCGMLSVIHPTPDDHWERWKDFDPETCRNDVVHNLMPVAMGIDEEGHGVVRLGVSGGLGSTSRR